MFSSNNFIPTHFGGNGCLDPIDADLDLFLPGAYDQQLWNPLEVSALNKRGRLPPGVPSDGLMGCTRKPPFTSYSLSECDNLENGSFRHYQVDSGYQTTHGGESLVPSNLASQQPSRCHSPPRGRPIVKSACQHEMIPPSWAAPWSTYRPSSMKATAPVGKSSSAASDFNPSKGGIQITVNRDVNFTIHKPERMLCLMNNLWEEEVECAREWLEKLDWKSYENYQAIQEKIATMEEYFRTAFNMEAPSCDFMEDCYKDVTSADTLLSMVESAWQCIEDEPVVSKSHCLTAPVTSKHSQLMEFGKDHHGTQPVNNNQQQSNKTNKSLQPSALKCPLEEEVRSGVIAAAATMSTAASISACATVTTSNSANTNSSNSSFSRPMQVHKRASKPKREDAFFNIRYKTQECSHYKKGLHCPAGENCHFAHGAEELRRPKQHPKFKTQTCTHFVKEGMCPFGDQCFFMHALPSAAEGANQK